VGAPVPEATVVDRPAWVSTNVEGFRTLLDPLLARLAERQQAMGRPGAVTAVGSRLTGAQLGLALAFLGTKVLGQYEVFRPPASDGAPAPGRLLLVAPNIVETERAMQAPARDFRMWVCLHESTHRTQFTAVPWLRGYLEDHVEAFLGAVDLDPAHVSDQLRNVVRVTADAVRGGAQKVSIIDAVTTPEQRAVLDRVTAVMTLLEGHAEHVMDAVGPEVVPSVGTIRGRFDERRRRGTGALDRVVRRLLGLDVKMRQYVEGRRFVDAAVDKVGMAGFNAVWQSPQTLPTLDEVADPDLWVRRVAG
jgi:coenzyme F420 biosynthesis associated uncharacterized protein